METSEKSLKQPQNEASDILKVSDDLKPAKQTTEVRQLFIGNLPFRAKWQDLKDLFRKAGQVIRANVALNQEGRSKGHGTVLFGTVKDAQKAIDAYNGYRWLGRVLEVRADRGFQDNENSHATREERATNKEDSVLKQEPDEENIEKVESLPLPLSAKIMKSSRQAAEEDNCKQLFVGNLPFHCQWQELKNLFKSEGRVIRADVVVNFEGRSRGFGTVLYASHDHAKKAIEKYNGFEFHNRTLKVHFDKFAANHQRLREHEANTFGQRQIHDPASLELLRQTYLPQQTTNYNHLITPYMLQTLPYRNNTMCTTTVPTTTTTTTTATTVIDNTLYNTNNYCYYNNYNNQSLYYVSATPTTSSMDYRNNSAMYSTTADRILYAASNMNLSDLTNNSQPCIYPSQSSSSPYSLPPPMQYQHLSNEEDNLSNSLERLHLPNTNNSAAGLNNNRNSGYMQP